MNRLAVQVHPLLILHSENHCQYLLVMALEKRQWVKVIQPRI